MRDYHTVTTTDSDIVLHIIPRGANGELPPAAEDNNDEAEMLALYYPAAFRFTVGRELFTATLDGIDQNSQEQTLQGEHINLVLLPLVVTEPDPEGRRYPAEEGRELRFVAWEIVIPRGTFKAEGELMMAQADRLDFARTVDEQARVGTVAPDGGEERHWAQPVSTNIIIKRP